MKNHVSSHHRQHNLWALINSKSVKAYFPEARFWPLQSILINTKLNPTMTVWNCLALLDHTSACIYMTLPVRLHLQSLQAWLRSAYYPTKQHMSKRIMVPQYLLSTQEHSKRGAHLYSPSNKACHHGCIKHRPESPNLGHLQIQGI